MNLYQRSLLILAEIPIFLGVSLLSASLFSGSASSQVAAPKKNPVPEVPKSAVPEVRAAGTEPFWGLTVINNKTNKTILYATPEGKTESFVYQPPQQAQGRVPGFTIVYPLMRNGSLRGNLILQKVYKGFCSDSMSDRRYPYTATLIINQKVFTGCAETPKLPAL